jgi:hypothetical protein
LVLTGREQANGYKDLALKSRKPGTAMLSPNSPLRLQEEAIRCFQPIGTIATGWSSGKIESLSKSTTS